MAPTKTVKKVPTKSKPKSSVKKTVSKSTVKKVGYSLAGLTSLAGLSYLAYKNKDKIFGTKKMQEVNKIIETKQTPTRNDLVSIQKFCENDISKKCIDDFLPHLSAKFIIDDKFLEEVNEAIKNLYSY
jgi:hypothetical protein